LHHARYKIAILIGASYRESAVETRRRFAAEAVWTTMICRKMRPAAMMKTPDPTLMSMAVRCS